MTAFVSIGAAWCVSLAQSADWVRADSTADWLAATAARTDLDPYGDLREIAQQLGVSYDNLARKDVGDAAWTHPRTPGALLMLQPLTLLSPSALYVLLGVASVASLAYLAVRRAPAVTGRSWSVCLAFGLAVLISRPMLQNVAFGSMTMLIALMVWLFWELSRETDSWTAGIWLGAAIGLRVFPALLLVAAFLARKPRAVASACLTFGLTNLLGMWLFDIDLLETIQGMTAAGVTWLDLPTNGSAVPFLSRIFAASPSGMTVALVVLSIGALVLVRKATRSVDLLVAWAIVLMLLASPLSWEAYDLLLLGPVASAWIPGDREIPRSLTVVWLGILVGVASVASALGLNPHLTAFHPALVVRALFIVILTHCSIGVWRRGRGAEAAIPPDEDPEVHRPGLGGALDSQERRFS